MDLESRLRGTRRGQIVTELFTNSLHFPLANSFLELLLEGPRHYLAQPDLYTLLAAGIAQAVVAGSWRYAGRRRALLGNLIGPALYTAVEATLEGPVFFTSPNHLAYWGFALAIGTLQSGQAPAPRTLRRALLVLEHVTRTCILLAMYAFFEALTDPTNATLAGFLSDASHRYVALVIPLLGVIIGAAHLWGEESLEMLRQTAGELRRYSSWLLGPQLLSRAVADPASMGLQRRERCVLFMDIRGFTAWSETHPADQVVEMLNGYFATAERVLEAHAVVKAQFIGDEVMCVLERPGEALLAAQSLRTEVCAFLAPQGLGSGIGLHRGVVIEGLIGARNVKSYTVIGDTVNTAKRVCDQAGRGEVLLTEALREAVGMPERLEAPRSLALKGKRQPLTVYPLRAEAAPPAGAPVKAAS